MKFKYETTGKSNSDISFVKKSKIQKKNRQKELQEEELNKEVEEVTANFINKNHLNIK